MSKDKKIKIFWNIGARNFEIRPFFIYKQFGLWKPELKKQNYEIR